MESENRYKHLEHRPGASYRGMYTKGRKIRAEILYRQTVGEDPRTPEQVAEDYDLSLETVLEAIDYSIKNEPLLKEERDRDWAAIRAHGWDKPPLVPPDFKPTS